MISPRTIKEFLDSLKMENDDQGMDDIVENLINKLNNSGNNPTTSGQSDEEKKKLEETLKCKLYGIILAKIGDRFWEKHGHSSHNKKS